MSGYAGYSMSHNAVDAYQTGLLPASKAAKKLGVSTEAIVAVLSPSEWHHTSSKFNKTNFYDVRLHLIVKDGGEALIDEDFDDLAAAAEELIKMREITLASKNDGEKIYENCVVEWLEWPFKPGCGGRWGDRRPTESNATNCTVIVKKQTAIIIFSNGEKMQKRLNTTGFNFYNKIIQENGWVERIKEVQNGCESQKINAA